MSKCIINEYMVTNSKLGNNKQIAFISDIHSDVDKFTTLIEKLYELKIRTLLIGGDLIDSTEEVKRNLVLRELLYELAKTMRIFITFGNHDMIYFDKESNNLRVGIKSSTLDFVESLANDNIYVPQISYNEATFDKWSLDDEIDINSLNLPIDHYLNKENTNDFIALLDEVEKPNINNHKFNILLCHSPKNIFTLGIDNDYLNQFDLILTGHMHSGLMPYFLRRQTYGRGFAGPYATLLPKFAYGYLNKNNTLLTSGGVTKLSDFPKLSSHKIFDTIYPSELEIFSLQHGDGNSFKRIKAK